MVTFERSGSVPAANPRGGVRAAARIAFVLLAASACAANAGAAWRHHGPEPRAGGFDRGGAVYVMTNDSHGNAILVFARDRAGRLHPVPHAATPTGGEGLDETAAIDPLGSQGALVYDEGVDMLFAVNAGDDTVTAFDAGPLGLRLHRRAVVSSGGHVPVSLAVSEDKLYVLNAGGTPAVATFAIGAGGGLEQIGSLDLGLGATSSFDQVMAPGQVGVDALARHLIITHAGGGELLVAELDDDGIPTGAPVSTPSPGIVPFAFGVTRYGTTLVAEAGSSSVSAFDPPAANGTLSATASAIVATGQSATCWIAVHDNGFAYVSNTGSDTLSLYHYTRTGGLALVDATIAATGGAPIDLTFANGGGFLYALDAGSGEISGFAIDAASGELALVDTQGGVPAAAGVQGIAARDF